MKVTFLGAARTVTGSCFLVETKNKRFLVDCGMFQGREENSNEMPFKFDVNSVDFMVLTHAHIDHSGRIPKLVKEGYLGPIYCTKATYDLCSILLPDSGHIHELEVEWKNRKRARAGKALLEPLYTAEEAQQSLKYFKYVFYDDIFKIDDNITIKFRDAGHILGSSMIEIWIEEDDSNTKLVFSGDLGQKNQPILRDPTIIEDADYVFVESTYGSRVHEEQGDRVDKLFSMIDKTVKRGGNVVIPSFAVGRTQELLYHINNLKEDKEHQYLKGVKVFIDSPLAISATKIFQDNPQCYDEETLKLLKSGDNPFEFDDLYFTRSTAESMEINKIKGGAVIISASGMCNAGRIKHHLKYNLWRPECSVLFVGYQAEGTLGRVIKDGAKKVKILGEEIGVLAEVDYIEGFSGHADRDGLMEWLEGFTSKPKKIFIVHGEADSSEAFARQIKERLGIETVIPKLGQTVDIKGKHMKEVESKAVSLSEDAAILNEIITRIMQVKTEFMELMEEIQDNVESGEFNLQEAKKSIEKIDEFLQKEKVTDFNKN